MNIFGAILEAFRVFKFGNQQNVAVSTVLTMFPKSRQGKMIK